MRRRTALLLTALVLIAGALARCGGEDEQAGAGLETADTTLTVYSGREEELVASLLEQFEEATGIGLEVRYGDSAELAATIVEEGGSSPADVFFAQDAGALGAIGERGLLAELHASALDRVDERFSDPDGRWVGSSGRVRVLVYNTDALAEGAVPGTVWDLLDPRWKGKIGFPPTNASFQAFVSALRLVEGDDRAREWLEGITDNDPKLYERNGQVIEAVANGEIEIGLVNHYYLYELLAEQPDAPVANRYLDPGDPGGLVNAAGVGILASTDAREAADAFVEYLLSDAGQEFYADAAEAEYPLVAGIEPRAGLPALDSLEGPAVELGALGEELPTTLELISEVGLTS